MPVAVLTGKSYTIAAAAKRTVKGQLVYKRDWDYEKGPGGPTVKMYPPNIQVEYWAALTKGGKIGKLGTGFTDGKGKWEFKDVGYQDAYLRVFQNHKDDKVVKISGYSNASAAEEYKIKKDKVINGKVDLDQDKLKKGSGPVDLGEVEISHSKFKAVCDIYCSLSFGHSQLSKMADYEAPQAQVLYPFPPSEGVSCAGGGKLFIAEDDAKDRSVLLHEWGHFIIDAILGSYTKDSTWPGGALYDYQTAGTSLSKNYHSPDSKEYLESGWNEGVANFFSCALSESPIYHDDYDTDLTFDLSKDKHKIGPHCEGSIQGALWHFFKSPGMDFKEDFWKVLLNQKTRKVRTIWGFHDNLKDSGRPEIRQTQLRDALKKHGMEFRYDFLVGGDRYKNIAAPKKFKNSLKQFRKIDELYDNFGKKDGGTRAIYDEEFFNRNRKFNNVPDGGLAPGSTYDNPKVKVGKKYIVPVRSKVK